MPQHETNQLQRLHVLVLGTVVPRNDSWKDLLKPALRRKFQVTWASLAAPPHELKAAVDRALHLGEQSSLEQQIQILDEAHRDRPFDALVNFGEKTVELAAAFGCKRGLKCNSIQAARTSRDKYIMRTVLKENSLPVPDFQLVSSREELYHAVDTIRYPCILKPISASGSRGVMVVSREEELESAYTWVQGVARDETKTSSILVESYVDGPEFSAEAIVKDGIPMVAGITAKKTLDDTYRDEIGHIFPAELEERQRKEAMAIIEATIRALAIRTGGTHTEFKLTAQGPVIMEIASRLGGDGIMNLVNMSCGIDLIDCVYLEALSIPYQILASRNRYVGVRFLRTNRRGLLKSISIPPAVFKLPGLLRAQIWTPPGSQVGSLNSGADRLGFILATGNSLQATDSILDEAERLCNECILIEHRYSTLAGQFIEETTEPFKRDN